MLLAPSSTFFKWFKNHRIFYQPFINNVPALNLSYCCYYGNKRRQKHCDSPNLTLLTPPLYIQTCAWMCLYQNSFILDTKTYWSVSLPFLNRDWKIFWSEVFFSVSSNLCTVLMCTQVFHPLYALYAACRRGFL